MDPLQLDPAWPSAVPLLDLETALEQSLLQSGLSRQDYIKRLVQDLHKPRLQPLLWLLPRRWRLAPAQLPQQLHGLAQLLERGLLTPSLLAVLGDEMAQLLPQPDQATTPLERWRGDGESSLKPWSEVVALSQSDAPADAIDAEAKASHLAPGLVWNNLGLHYGQNQARRQANSAAAQWLNHHAARGGSRELIETLQQRGWQIKARFRASVASFGLGACFRSQANDSWQQIPIGLPMRSGLLDQNGQEITMLLPHSAVEMELCGEGCELLLQFYQGTEGICGWEALNDLQRPWQNDRHNGTVRYMGEPWQGSNLLELMDLTDVMALVHNSVASELQLRWGGYGSVGYCIDTTALVQQALLDQCDLFPLLLNGIWRERLLRTSQRLPASSALQRYQKALMELPLDLSHHGSSSTEAWRRLQGCQPLSSPFCLSQHIQHAPNDFTAVAL